MRRAAMVLGLLISATTGLADEISWMDREDCAARNFRWSGNNAVVAKETIDAGAIGSLKASVSQAPVRVSGGNTGYSIDVCKAAERPEDLAAIRVFLDGNELRATGPSEGKWLVTYHIRVPDGANLEVETEQGPLSLRDVDGTVVARTHNGPLSLKNISGNVTATAKNGPVSVRGGSGTMSIRSSNGPLSIHLDGTSWVGGTLDASTKNGPLTVKMPRGYGSGVVVESSGRGPLSCNAEGCERVRTRTAEDRWNDEPQRVELGSGPATVHLSTVNGPVTIKDE